MNASFSKDENTFQRQGSIRKVIPGERNVEILHDQQNNDIQQVYKIYKQEYVILTEFKMVQNENIPGVYVIPSKESSLIWFGVIFVRKGIYEDGVFRFTIYLSDEFPDSGHPKVVFNSKIYHPVIDANTNELNLLKAFPKWSKFSQHLWQVIKFIQWIFYDVERSVEHAVNMDAVELYKSDIEKFKQQALDVVKESKDHLYDEPPTDDQHYITFEPYVAEIHDKVRAQIMSTQIDEKTSKTGLSWVLPGSKKPLTRPETPPPIESDL